MRLFRRLAAGRPLPAGAAVGGVAASGIRTAQAGAHAAAGQVQGWAPGGYITPHQYMGTYSGTPVTQRAAYSAGVQRLCGTEGLSSSWMVPAYAAGPSPLTGPGGRATALGNSWAGSQVLGNTAGTQRIVGSPSGGLGPITARTMRSQITRAQILQSGLSAVQWAQSLSPVAGI